MGWSKPLRPGPLSNGKALNLSVVPRPRAVGGSQGIHALTVPLKVASRLRAETALVPMIDAFADDRPAGTVIGSCTTSGARRLGCDAEHQVAIDRGALRFQPLVTPGWGREGIAYGPFRRTSGLVLAVSVTNGHNTSQGGCIPESFAKRIARWLLGPGIDPWVGRLMAWLRSPRKKGTLRRFHWWLRSTRPFYRLPEFKENLAVGWFTTPAPSNPLSDGCGFVIHAAEGENGELWTRVAGHCLAALRRLQNLQFYYVIVLRERGAIYYAAAMKGAHGVAAFPMMRPIAVDPFNDDKTLYAGIHQCALGQIGFRVDTRVHGVHIERMPEFASPFATAHAGDRLTGTGPLTGAAERGGAWRLLTGKANRGSEGVTCAGDCDAIAVLEPGAPSGLVHALVALDTTSGSAGIVWHVLDQQNYWLLKVSNEGAALIRFANGAEICLASDQRWRLQPLTTHSIQVLETDDQLGCYLDGECLFDSWFNDPALASATGVGVWLDASGHARMRNFEAQPRQVPAPSSLRFDAAWARLGQTVELADDFRRAQGDLAGCPVAAGNGYWEKTLGDGALINDSGAACVSATVEHPNPGRTFYTLPWRYPGFADLEVTITPPGQGRGEKQNCRGGLVFWQDNENYLSFTAYLDDGYRGASIALFTKRHGFEELYDAIWTMVWDKVTWGKPFRLRIACDGDHFLVLLDDEPILQRCLADLYPSDPPLRIRRVGLAVNWEWGNDTGSRFQSFTARVEQLPHGVCEHNGL